MLDISGHKYGKLTPLAPAGKTPTGQMIWKCACDCGSTIAVRSNSLRSRNTVSCGCHKAEVLSSLHRTHGASANSQETQTYVAWKAMKQRCSPRNAEMFPYYAGRGIGVCQEWADNYLSFLAHMGERPDGLTLERIDNDVGYEPGNCTWATRTAQARNSRQVLRITLCGTVIPVIEACERFGLNHHSLRALMRRHKISAAECFYSLLDRSWDFKRAAAT